MPAVPSWLMNPLWDQFSALLPAHPLVDPSHPLGCHRPRINDRIVFEKLVQVLRFGCLHGEIAHKGDKAPIQAGQPRHVERTNARHNAFNRLQRCYERTETVIDAYIDLADAIITPPPDPRSLDLMCPEDSGLYK